jgi:hypothetical protein
VKRFDLLPASFAFSNFLLDHQSVHAAMRADMEQARAREVRRDVVEESLDDAGTPRNYSTR